MQKPHRNIKAKEREENLSQQLVSKYMPYWPLFLLFGALAVAGAWVYMRYYTTPLYQATARLIIKDEKKGNENSKLTESLDLISSKKLVENEIEVIQSRTLMTEVVKKLALYAPMFEKGKVKTVSAYVSSPVSIEIENPDSLKEYGRIDYSYSPASQKVLLQGKYSCVLNEFLKTPFGNLRFSPNKNYSGEPIPADKQLYFSLTRPSTVGWDMLQSLAAAASSKLSTVVNLQYQDVNPKRASDVLNALIYEYELHAIQDKNTLARNTLAFVDERLNMVTKDLGQIEGKLQQYKSGRGAVDISTQGQMYLQNVSSNDQKLGETNLQLSVLDQVDNFISNNSSGVLPSTFGVNDPTLSGMLERLHNAELEYTKLKATVGENNPKLVELRNQIAEMQPAIKQNIESQRKSLLAAKQSLQSTNSGYSSMLSTVPLKERELLDISREHGIKSSIYTFLLQKKEETELSLASAVSNSRIVDNAVTDKDPVSPKKKLIYVIALFAGMGICFLFITIRETFTGKILYRKEIEKLTTIPVIAEVAFEKTKDPIVVKHGKRSFVIEEFRKLRTSLSFLGVGPQHRKILVTSSISGEGKSFIAANLAVSIALTGKKVVLVDLDLNVPTQSKILGVNYEFGISDFLRGQKYPEEIIKKLPGYEDLFFIPSGSLSENPSELLLNGKVNELIDYLDNSFDMVIIDTSPVVLITDAYILSEMCDATLYVMRHNYTPRMVVKRIDENLEINPINNPAIVFNGVKRRGIFRNHYGYGYNYVYGDRKYGYGKTAKS